MIQCLPTVKSIQILQLYLLSLEFHPIVIIGFYSFCTVNNINHCFFPSPISVSFSVELRIRFRPLCQLSTCPTISYTPPSVRQNFLIKNDTHLDIPAQPPLTYSSVLKALLSLYLKTFLNPSFSILSLCFGRKVSDAFLYLYNICFFFLFPLFLLRNLKLPG